MNTQIEALTKLAEDLTNRVASLETENNGLRAALLEQSSNVKQASATPSVSVSVALSTCEKLVGIGAITETQVEQVKQAFLTDPSAVHRALCGIIDAQTQAKSASTEACSAGLDGGTLVSGTGVVSADVADKYGTVERILGMQH